MSLQKPPTKERAYIYPQGITTKKEFIEYSIKNGCKVRERTIMYKKTGGYIVVKPDTDINYWLKGGFASKPVKQYELYNTGETGWAFHDITREEYKYALQLGAQTYD